MRTGWLPIGRRRRESRIERRLLWIFGSPRSGSTWLASLLAQGGNVVKVDEPGIGSHLGVTLDSVLALDAGGGDIFRLEELRRDRADYFFARDARHAWEPGLRRLLLQRLGGQLGDADCAVIKEPNGSEGADLVMSALPGSRLIFLLRDGRDVVDSQVDASSPGSWAMSTLPGFQRGDRLEFVRRQSQRWLWRTCAVEAAYANHASGLRLMVRYEDLLAAPTSHLGEMARWLDLDEAAIAEAAERTSFEKISPAQRGPGRFARAARPGAWRENLEEAEKAAMMEIMGPKLRQLGYR